jgi:hypothetical protein
MLIFTSKDAGKVRPSQKNAQSAFAKLSAASVNSDAISFNST